MLIMRLNNPANPLLTLKKTDLLKIGHYAEFSLFVIPRPLLEDPEPLLEVPHQPSDIIDRQGQRAALASLALSNAIETSNPNELAAILYLQKPPRQPFWH